MNFNAMIHSFNLKSYRLGLRLYTWPRWIRYQIIRLFKFYIPAMQREKDRKSFFRIILELIIVSKKFRCLPIHYFHYGLYSNKVLTRDLFNYLPEDVFYYRSLPVLNQHHIVLDDKILTDEILSAHHIPTPELIAVRRNGIWFSRQRKVLNSFSHLKEEIERYASWGVIIKPSICTSGGIGIVAPGREELGKHLLDLYDGDEDIIIQRRERNGGSLADLKCKTLLSFRVLTVISGRGVEVPYITLKLSSQHSVVDNGHFGGIYVDVNISTGQLGSLGHNEQGEEVRHTPSTATLLSSIFIHEIQEIVLCAKRAAIAFPYLYVVGWDIALTDRGALVIEGNSSPGLGLMQRPHKGLKKLIDYLALQDVL